MTRRSRRLRCRQIPCRAGWRRARADRRTTATARRARPRPPPSPSGWRGAGATGFRMARCSRTRRQRRECRRCNRASRRSCHASDTARRQAIGRTPAGRSETLPAPGRRPGFRARNRPAQTSACRAWQARLRAAARASRPALPENRPRTRERRETGLRSENVSRPAPSTTTCRVPRATLAASASSEKRLRETMNSRIPRRDGSAAIPSSAARVSSSRICSAKGSRKIAAPSCVWWTAR